MASAEAAAMAAAAASATTAQSPTALGQPTPPFLKDTKIEIAGKKTTCGWLEGKLGKLMIIT